MQSYKSIGYSVISVSAKNNDGMDELKTYLTNKNCIFVGQIGVGKSSLINQLVPENNSAMYSPSRQPMRKRSSLASKYSLIAFRKIHLVLGVPYPFR